MLSDDVVEDSSRAKPIEGSGSQVNLSEHTYGYLVGDYHLKGGS